MDRKMILLGFVLALAIMFCATGYAQEMPKLWSSEDGEVAVLKSGEWIASSGGKITIKPLFVITVGDILLAEIETLYWSRVLACYAVNMTMYVKESNVEIWKATTYRRPKSQKEVEKFLKNPASLAKKRLISRKDLPLGLGQLDSAELSQISFISVYLIGGVKIYPVDGITFEQAKELAEKIETIILKRGERND